jgi:cytidylate kinase
MAVITISRELGSEGDKIGDLVCAELGYQRVDKAILMQIAQDAGVDIEAVLEKERGFTKRARLISSDLTSLYRKQPTAFEGRSELDDETYRDITRKTLEAFADQGDVIIVGRGGQMVLQKWPTALHVSIYAPLEMRIQRIQQRENITARGAQRRISESDEQKRQYIRYMHNNANWKDPKYYHLIINTGHVSRETAAQVIILAAKDKADAAEA